jgi:hypothetical protein
MILTPIRVVVMSGKCTLMHVGKHDKTRHKASWGLGRSRGRVKQQTIEVSGVVEGLRGRDERRIMK